MTITLVPTQPKKIKLEWTQLNDLIGIDIPPKEVNKILKNLGFTIDEENTDSICVFSPTYRVDVERPADVIEEVLRIYGFNRIPLSNQLSSNYFASFTSTYKNQIQYEKTLELSAIGWSEINTNSLENPVFSQESSWLPDTQQVHLLNANSIELSAMRQSMLFSGLSIISRNINYKQRHLKLFEFGKVYKKIDKQQYEEQNKLCFWSTGNTQQAHWSVKEEKVSFHTIKQTIHTHILKYFKKESLSLSINTFENTPFTYALYIKHKDNLLASIGILEKKVLKKFEILNPPFT